MLISSEIHCQNQSDKSWFKIPFSLLMKETIFQHDYPTIVYRDVEEWKNLNYRHKVLLLLNLWGMSGKGKLEPCHGSVCTKLLLRLITLYFASLSIRSTWACLNSQSSFLYLIFPKFCKPCFCICPKLNFSFCL